MSKLINHVKLILASSTLLITLSCTGVSGKSSVQLGNPVIYVITEGQPSSEDRHYDQISEVVRKVFQDSRGDLWFGTQDGAFKYSGDSLIIIDDIKSENGKGITIKDITEDKDGVVWFAHTDGVSSVEGVNVNNYYESDGLLSNDAWCITADAEGNIWIGTIEGVSVFDGQTFSNFDLPNGISDSTLAISSTGMVHSIMEDSYGTLWFSTNAGLFSYANNNLVNKSKEIGIQTNFVNEIYEDSKGDFWISTKADLYHLHGNEIYNVTKDKIEVGKGIGSIAEDKEGTIWFVANQHYLYTYDGKVVTEFQKTETNKGPVVFQIFKDMEDRLWFVGYGGAYRLENDTCLNVTKDGPW